MNANSARHPGGRTCAGMAVLAMAVPAFLVTLVARSFKGRK